MRIGLMRMPMMVVMVVAMIMAVVMTVMMMVSIKPACTATEAITQRTIFDITAGG